MGPCLRCGKPKPPGQGRRLCVDCGKIPKWQRPNLENTFEASANERPYANRAEYKRKRYEDPAYRELVLGKAKAWRDANPETIALSRKRSHLKRRYGMTVERFDELAANGCHLCNRVVELDGFKRIGVDHDHRCCPGPVSCGSCLRGLLCWSCNLHMG